MLVVAAKPKRVRADDESLLPASTSGAVEPWAETAAADIGDVARAGGDDNAGHVAGGLLGGLMGDYGSEESDDDGDG